MKPTKLLKGEKIDFSKSTHKALKDDTKPVKVRKPNAAFDRPLAPDAVLSAIIGPEPRSRAEITKAVWAEIKKGPEQNPPSIFQKGRNLYPNEDPKWILFFRFTPFLEKDEPINMFDVPKAIKAHTK